MKVSVIFFSLFFVSIVPVFAQSEISDADGDTKIQTEKFVNEDVIRMDLKGRERFVIRRNANESTLLEVPTSDLNLFIGLGPGSNNSGTRNTYLGQECGVLNTTGQENTFVGHGAGHGNTTGTFNTFLGDDSGLFNSIGNHNTFLGESAGFSNTTASENTYIGASSGVSGTTAQFNAFLGAFTGFFNTASGNAFAGHSAGRNNTSGSANTFFGRDAGRNNTTASNNTYFGSFAGAANMTGTGNTALGKSAGDTHAANVNCTFLGNGADALLNGITNSTAIGNGAIVNAHNKIRLGNTAITVIEGQVIYTTSDGRFKSEVKSDAPGLAFVMGLRPVTYLFDYTKFSDFLGEENVDYPFLKQKEQNREMGFIAQEVEQLCAKEGLSVSNIVHVPEGEADNYSIAYGQLVVPLVKAVQEQQAEIEELKALVNQLLSERQSKADSKQAVDNIRVWPNPAGEAVYVSIPARGFNTAISLFSSDGVLIQTTSSQEAVQKMDIKALPAGTYYIQILTHGQAPVVKTIVKGQ